MYAPRLVDRVFGDGGKLLEISPIMHRPHTFVVRIGSDWTIDNWDRVADGQPDGWLDDVLEAVIDQYPQPPWDEDADTSFEDGLSWDVINWPTSTKKKSRR